MVRMAGLIAGVFQIDPKVVLDGTYFELALRHAAANIWSREQAKANEKSKK